MKQTHKAFAKINIGLRVLGKRADSYHDIETIFHRVNLYDEIELDPAQAISVVSTSPEAPSGDANICYKAAHLLQEHLAINRGVRITINKKIPVGAGLGGGSSDAAVILKALPRFWNAEVDEATLKQLALQLGSDVPFFLGDQSACGTGRGEVLDFFPVALPYHILLCNPNIHVSTAWAYSNMKPDPVLTGDTLKEILLQNISKPEELRQGLRNDFEASVFEKFPVIRWVKEEMLARGAVLALMSGSGSSVFGLYQKIDAAEETSLHLLEKGFKTFHTPLEFRL